MIKYAEVGSKTLRKEKENEKAEKEKLKNTSYKNGNGIPNTKLRENEYLDYDKQVKNGNH